MDKTKDVMKFYLSFLQKSYTHTNTHRVNWFLFMNEYLMQNRKFSYRDGVAFFLAVKHTINDIWIYVLYLYYRYLIIQFFFSGTWFIIYVLRYWCNEKLTWNMLNFPHLYDNNMFLVPELNFKFSRKGAVEISVSLLTV